MIDLCFVQGTNIIELNMEKLNLEKAKKKLDIFKRKDEMAKKMRFPTSTAEDKEILRRSLKKNPPKK